ncbi:MAG: phosphate ABC transporter substrate-binding/OmpA family protein [Minicystis sp.]
MRLTLLSKVFIALVVVGTAGFIVWNLQSKGSGKGDGAAASASASAEPAPAGPKTKRDPKRIVVGVNDFGGAYPGVVANDGATPGPKSRFTAAGLDVEFKLIRGSKERLQAFDDGEVDVMLLSLDYFANLVPIYKEKGVDLRAFLMADWSRGNLGIVAKPGIKSIEGLKDAKIATTRNTPTHYFLINLLKRSNLTAAEIEKIKANLVFATKTPQAGEMFQRGEVDAVAIWEPHLSQAAAGGKGRVLVSTATATNLIADVLYARADYLAAHEADIQKLVHEWFEGVKQIEKDANGSVATVAKAFKQTDDETRGVLAKIKPTTFADNRVFFGMEREDAAFTTLFDDASRVWQSEGVIKTSAIAAQTRYLKALESMSREFAQEQVVEKWAFKGGPKQDTAPLLTKSVSVFFPTGVDRLDANAKKVVDGFAEVVAQFGNAYVRVEGNTDNEGDRAANQTLSKRRADALVDYLVTKHGFDRSRFVTVGNGPDKPVGDNRTPDGREQNRRTDFQIIPNTN